MMNISNIAIALLTVLAYLPSVASSSPLLGSGLGSFTALAGGYATYGAGATIGGQVGASTYVVGGANSKSDGDFTNTDSVKSALDQLSTAKSALNNMGQGTVLLATMSGSVNLSPGLYSASALTTAAGTILTLDGGGADSPYWVFNIPTYLVTGASTHISIQNAGPNASVIWNTGGYAALGADTNFAGSILAGSYISVGANANISCGNAFALSYISIPAGANMQSKNCAGSGTWAGSTNGLGSGLDIVDGMAVATAFDVQQQVSAIPEPGTYTLVLAGLFMMFTMNRRRKNGI